MTTILVSVPMLIIGTLVSTPAMSIAFYISFCSLRTRTNGLHAKTLAGCLILSIISEIFFLGILPCILDDTVTISLLIVSTISIAVLAPYNHPNMALSAEESMACAKSAKKRLLILILLLIIIYVMRLKQFVNSTAKSFQVVIQEKIYGSSNIILIDTGNVKSAFGTISLEKIVSMKKFVCFEILRQAVSRNRHRFLNTPLPCLHSLGAQDAYFNTLTARDFRVIKCNHTSFFIDPKNIRISIEQ